MQRTSGQQLGQKKFVRLHYLSQFEKGRFLLPFNARDHREKTKGKITPNSDSRTTP
jgi:hypothetical protein